MRGWSSDVRGVYDADTGCTIHNCNTVLRRSGSATRGAIRVPHLNPQTQECSTG
jgi:hypothetical protein